MLGILSCPLRSDSMQHCPVAYELRRALVTLLETFEVEHASVVFAGTCLGFFLACCAIDALANAAHSDTGPNPFEASASTSFCSPSRCSSAASVPRGDTSTSKGGLARLKLDSGPGQTRYR